MKILDLYCCQGGAAKGYDDAGFDVTGVDKYPQPRYPYRFVLADAIAYVLEHGAEYDFIHASPPCQLDSDTQVIQGREHPDLIGPTRDALEATGVPYVIENVGGATSKLRNPQMLCGWMFGLTLTYRHRFFETGGWEMSVPEHPWHTARQAKMGRMPRPGETVQAIGNYAGSPLIKAEWGVPWMNRDGTREAIPPAYSRYVGEQFMKWKEQNG